VVKEQAGYGVESGNLGQVAFCQFELEDVEILCHALGLYGLRDRDDAALNQPAEHDLRNGSPMNAGDGAKHRVREQVVPALREGGPADVSVAD